MRIRELEEEAEEERKPSAALMQPAQRSGQEAWVPPCFAHSDPVAWCPTC